MRSMLTCFIAGGTVVVDSRRPCCVETSWGLVQIEGMRRLAGDARRRGTLYADQVDQGEASKMQAGSSDGMERQGRKGD
jgi:hypothetical protein